MESVEVLDMDLSLASSSVRTSISVSKSMFMMLRFVFVYVCVFVVFWVPLAGGPVLFCVICLSVFVFVGVVTIIMCKGQVIK